MAAFSTRMHKESMIATAVALHHVPEYYAQPHHQSHSNAASTVQDVWIVDSAAPDLADFMCKITGVDRVKEGTGLTVLQTRTGTIVLARPEAFEAAFGVSPPHREAGPHLAGFTIGCRTLVHAAALGLPKVGGRYVVPPSSGFGTTIGFIELPSQA